MTSAEELGSEIENLSLTMNMTVEGKAISITLASLELAENAQLVVAFSRKRGGWHAFVGDLDGGTNKAIAAGETPLEALAGLLAELADAPGQAN